MDQIGQFPNENLYDTEVKQAEMLNPVMMKYDFIIEMLHSILQTIRTIESKVSPVKLSILTVICLGENVVLNSQSNCEGEPADHESRVVYLFKPTKFVSCFTAYYSRRLLAQTAKTRGGTLEVPA